jgi:16S rRNA (uracil1498-N3)-methyltransferase
LNQDSTASFLHPRFFVAASITRDGTFPRTLALDEHASMHLRVLRLHEDEMVTLFDGAGGEFEARIVSIGKREVIVELNMHHAIERESNLNITLVQALATGDKMDWIIQKATELGVTAIQPVQTQRATAKLNAERAEKRAVHWQGVVTATCEQCGRNRLPKVHGVMDFSAWLRKPSTVPRVMLHPDTARGAWSKVRAPVAIIIGPEGGFAQDEIFDAERAGVTLASFGVRVLRTETAGLAAITALQTVAGEWI